MDQTPIALFAKLECAIDIVVEFDNTDNEKTGIMSETEINDELPVSLCVTQPKNSDAGEQFLKTHNTEEVPVCNDLVDLSCEMIHKANFEQAVAVLNSNLENSFFLFLTLMLIVPIKPFLDPLIFVMSLFLLRFAITAHLYLVE